MKNIIKYAALSLLAVAGITMTSCSSDPRYDVVGNGANLVYFKAPNKNTVTGKVTHTPVGDFGSLNAEFPVKVQHALSGSATVTVTVDPALVEAYNAKNNTTYAVLPESAVNLENKTIKVSPNTTNADDTLRITLNETATAALTEPAYMLAVRLQANGGGMQGSEEQGIAYVIVETATDLIQDNPSELLGTAVDDISAWTCVSATNYNTDELKLTNWKFSQMRISNASFVVDLGATHKVSGFKLDCYTGTGYRFYVSEDNSNWTDLGDTDGKGQAGGYYVLYGGVPARYVKVEQTLNSSHWGWNYGNYGWGLSYVSTSWGLAFND